MKPKKLSKTQVQATLKAAIDDAVSFVDSEIAPERVRAQKYFEGWSSIGYEEGRSRVVATKCRDTVRAVMPALMRLFLQSDKPVEFLPNNDRTVVSAEEQSDYARHVFERNNGFRVLYDVFFDALRKKVGIVKPYYDEVPEVTIDEYSGLPPEAMQLLAEDPEIEVIDAEQDETGLVSFKVSRKATRGTIRFESVAPEDFFVDRGAKSIRDYYVCGHSTEGRVGDLVAMGFDFEKVIDLAGSDNSSVADEEELERTGWDDDDNESPNDPSMRKIIITEAYMRMDIEGTGVPKQYKFLCAGEDYEILDYELCDHQPFAIFEVDPEPHTFFGRSLVELVEQDQDASTSLLRGLLDSISMANNPSMWAVESKVNVDDLMNNEVGRIIRVKEPGVIGEFTVGSAATAALPAMQYYDDLIRGKTGIVGAGMGLDTEALQSQTASGVRLAEQTTAAAAELIARILAEGGMKDLFRIIVQLAIAHPNPEEMIRVGGQFVPVDPRSWNSELDMQVNVGLGTNKTEERIAALMHLGQFQQAVWQAYGPQNGLVSMTGIRNLQADIAKVGGVYNIDRYLNPMDPQREQMLLQQMAAQSQDKGSDPNQAYLQAEMAKVQQKAQADVQKAQIAVQKAQADTALKAQELQMKDDLERDKMAQDRAIASAELVLKGSRLNERAIVAEQMAPRMPGV